MATQYSNKPIVTDGLVYALDFGNPKSYVSGSTTANSLIFEATPSSTVTGSTFLPNNVNATLVFTGSQWIQKTGSFNALNFNGVFTIQAVINSRTSGTLFSQTSSVGNFTSQITTTGSGFGFSTNINYNRQATGLSSTQLNHITYRYSSGSLDIFYNGLLVTSSQANITLPTSSIVNNFYINGLNGLTNNFSGSIASIYVYNRALTSDEIWNNYQLTAPRYGLGPLQNKPYTLDENAYLFLQSAGITDPIITGSIDTFVRGLKSASLWDKMIAIYPFVGTGSTGINLTGSHRWNLKEPSLVTYPLTFTGSWIGSTSGSAPSGSGTNITMGGVTPTTVYPFYNSQSAHISILSYDTPVSSSYLMGTGMTEDLAISTLAGDYGTPAAAYSVRKVRTAYSGALMDVRRSIDNVTSSIGFVSNGDLDTGSLLDFVVAGRTVLPGAYSGLAAAYSLRKVSSSYTGDAIEVRRDWDNESGSFGFDANGDLDTVSLLTFVTGSAGTGSGFVAQWYDQSGNGRHATQTATGSQPLIVSSGSLVTRNNKPALRFDGVDDNISAIFGTTITQPISTHLVSQNSNTTSSIFYDSADDTNRLVFGFNTDGTSSIFAGTELTGSIATTGSTILSAYYSSSNSSYYLNSILNATGDAGVNSISSLTIGSDYSGSSTISGSVQELFLYSTDQSSNRSLIENNINNYYNIYTGSNHGFVARWYDQSGNNRHASQTATGSQPIIVRSGSLIMTNNKPAPTWVSSSLTSSLQGISRLDMYVVQQANSTTYLYPHSSNILGSYGMVVQSGSTSTNLFNNYGTPTFFVNNNLFSGTTRGALFTAISSSQRIVVQQNTSTAVWPNFYIAAFPGLEYSGSFQEMIFYSGDQSTNREAINYGINSYYNIYPQTSSFATSSFTIKADSGSISGSLNNRLTSGIAASGPLGLITVSRTGSNSLTIARNGVTSSFTVPASGALSTGIYLGAINNNGLALGNSPLNISFASVGTGLTNSENRTYNGLVQGLNFNLGRNYLLKKYPNAIAVYSLRKINPEYTGPALRVRRSSDNAMQDIQYTAINELDTISLSSFVGRENTGFVQIWYDQSGNNNHVFENNTSIQPIIVQNNSIYSFNNKPGVLFENANLSLGRSIGSITAATTYTVFSSPIVKSAGTVWWTGNSNTWWWQFTTGFTRIFSTDRRDGFPSPMKTSGQVLFSSYHTGSLMQVFQNSISLGSNNASSFTAGSDLILGGRGTSPGTHNGPIHELIIYPVYNTGSRIDIENNINTYYQIY